MNTHTLPTYFVSHGGGPWPYIDGLKDKYAKTAAQLRQIPHTLDVKPNAVLVISGHWEQPEFTVSTAEHPPMVYDYSGFPEHTYHIKYPAPGSPSLAARVRELLGFAGIKSFEDPQRGFDHGTFVPMMLMYPNAEVPVVTLSMKASYDPNEHISAGQALQALRSEGVLIIGSGLTYHNMRGFGQPDSMGISTAFEAYLNDAVTTTNPEQRLEKLVHWESAPMARLVHPREDHLIPLLLVAGAAGNDPGQRLMLDRVMNVAMASYRFGHVKAHAD